MAEWKDASEAWKEVKTLNGEAPTPSGKALMYQGREYCSYKAKASAFCREYARISGRGSDKASRRLNREMRRDMQWHRYAPKQAIEGGCTCTCDDIHPARAESASMALTASRTAADQARRSWVRPIASDAHFLFHLRMPTTAGPMCRTRSSFSVVAQVLS